MTKSQDSTERATTLLPTPQGILLVPLQPPIEAESVYLSLILPTYNEAENIAPMVERLCAVLNAHGRSDYEILVIDDNSPDHTWQKALEIAGVNPRVRVMRRMGERGLSSAVIRGWQAARGEILGVIDADLQHPPEMVAKLLDSLKENCDLAVGSRHVEGGGVSDWSYVRRLISRGAQVIGLMILPEVVGRVSDPMSGCFMVRRNCLAGIELDPLGYKILIEVLGRARIQKICEVGYVFQERSHGSSKLTKQVYIDYLGHLLKLRVSRLWQSTFLRYATVGASGVVVDMAILYLLSDPSTLHWGLTRSKVIAAELAMISNFYWNDLWTFADRTINQRNTTARLRRLLKFNTICLLGLVLNVVVLNVLFNLFGVNQYLANGVAIAATTAWNYWFSLKLGWRVSQVKSA